ncbi:hypothetical protein [Streptomyces sp. AD681]|uniref:hypothetical protein n=1 Tax=Streptomyces sp. AD681 TaxID=3019069 RepID=UPI0022F17ABC|nr:hypothetical protein [Streptomyces sp. AD681]
MGTEKAAMTGARPRAGEPLDILSASRRRRGLVLAFSVMAGFLLTVVWSAEFVDQTVGGSVAEAALGHSPEAAPLTSVLTGAVFAFVSGLAGTFTACNIAVFGAVTPLMDSAGTRWERTRRSLVPLGWMSLGMVTVSALYGAVVGLVGTSMPQFSQAENVPGTLSGRSVQSMVVFGLIGLAMLWMGLAALGYLPDPLARVSARFVHARTLFLGVLVGGFLVGRPYPLFRQLFRDAAESGNPFYGALAFVLQSVGNIVVMAALFLLLSSAVGRRHHSWLARKPGRAALVTGAALVVAGAFTLLYWDLRLLARREILPWYPVAPWAQ